MLRLVLPESPGGSEDSREYSLEELKELLNKLMLLSGKKDHNSSEVEVFSEVSALAVWVWPREVRRVWVWTALLGVAVPQTEGARSRGAAGGASAQLGARGEPCCGSGPWLLVPSEDP